MKWHILNAFLLVLVIIVGCQIHKTKKTDIIIEKDKYTPKVPAAESTNRNLVDVRFSNKEDVVKIQDGAVIKETLAMSKQVSTNEDNSIVITLRAFQICQNLDGSLFGLDYETDPPLYTNVKHGDVNLDGNVNLADIQKVQVNMWQSGPHLIWTEGDVNFDDTVNLNDVQIIQANFGQ